MIGMKDRDTILRLCVATTIHNFKWLIITYIGLIWHKQIANIDVLANIPFPITVI